MLPMPRKLPQRCRSPAGPVGGDGQCLPRGSAASGPGGALEIPPGQLSLDLMWE